MDAILKQTQRLANNLAFAFNTPTGIPSNNLFFNPPRTDGGSTNGLATIGTLVLEYTHLSDLTGNKTYAQISQKAESYLLSPKPASSEPWPGLLGMNVDINTGLFQDAFGGWVGGADSFYEYLIKMVSKFFYFGWGLNRSVAVSPGPAFIQIVHEAALQLSMSYS